MFVYIALFTLSLVRSFTGWPWSAFSLSLWVSSVHTSQTRATFRRHRFDYVLPLSSQPAMCMSFSRSPSESIGRSLCVLRAYPTKFSLLFQFSMCPNVPEMDGVFNTLRSHIVLQNTLTHTQFVAYSYSLTLFCSAHFYIPFFGFALASCSSLSLLSLSLSRSFSLPSLFLLCLRSFFHRQHIIIL